MIRRTLDGLWNRVRDRLWRWHPAGWLANPRRVPVDRPLFLLGTQGGGLTLMSRVLRRHPAAVSVTGDHRYWTGSDEMQNVLSRALPESLRLRGAGALERRGIQDSWRYATDAHLPAFRRTAEDATRRDAERLRRTLARVIAVHGRRVEEGAPRLVDKSQSYTVKVSYLEALLAESRPHFVLVLRNPFAVCRRAAVEVLADGAGRRRRLELASQHWANSVECALEDGEGLDRFATLRFEDFLARPEEELDRLCRFAGLDADASLRRHMLPAADDRMPLGTPADEKWYPLRPDVNRRHLEGLRPGDAELIRERCGRLADRFGYTAEGP